MYTVFSSVFIGWWADAVWLGSRFNMADGNNWMVNVVGNKGTRGSGPTRRVDLTERGLGGVRSLEPGFPSPVQTPVSHLSLRDPVRRIALSGSSVAAPGTSCTTTMSTGSSRPASSGCAT